MKIIFAILFIVCGSILFAFKSLESNLLEGNFSWTISKSLPYLVLVMGGILLAYSFAKAFKMKSGILKALVVILLIVAPFGIGFAMHPIYEGDFSSEGKEISDSKLEIDKKYDLLVITIPDCPYCLESIFRLKLIKKRNPSIKILFSVCTSEEQKLSLYKELIAGDFDIETARDLEASIKLAEGSFPAFVHMKKGIPVYKWSNDQFGAGAIDELEAEIK